MTILQPFAFWFLAIAPLIVLLYLLKLRRRAATVSTLMFWQRVMTETRRRALFQRLRQILSLLLHLLILLLLLFALARPELARFFQGGTSTALVIDTSVRAQAQEPDGETRFEKARRLAESYARRAGPRNQIALIAAGAAPEVVVPFTGDEKALLEGISKLAPTDAAGSEQRAFSLAQELVAARSGAKKIVLIGDRAPDRQPEGVEVTLALVGGAQENVAITNFTARALINSPQTYDVLLQLENFGGKPVSGNVELRFEGQLFDVKPFALEPGEKKISVYPAVPSTSNLANARGWLTAKLDVKDALATDNEAFAIIPPAAARRVLLVSKGNFFLEKLLEADLRLKFDLLAPEAFQPALARSFDAVIFDNYVPPGLDMANLPEGNFLFIKQSPLGASTGALDSPLVTDLDEQSPLLRMVNLRNVTFLRAEKLPFAPETGDWRLTAPVRSFENPLVIAGTHRLPDVKEQRLVSLAFDLLDSDLPMRIAFPLLMSNSIQWLAGQPIDSRASYRSGETIALDAGQAVWTRPQTVFQPLGEIKPEEIARSIFQPQQNGFYLLRDKDQTSWIAVNTFSSQASDLRPSAAAAAPPPPEPSLPLARAWWNSVRVWPLWVYLAIAAFVFFSFEWWLFNRRRTE